MKVFDLPYSTEVNKVVPKNAFETYSSPKQKKQFTELVQKITWLNKLSVETTNLNSIEIKEIQIFHFELKSKQKIDSLITVVDKAIPYPIVFIISIENEYYISTSKKHLHPLNHDNAIIDWRFESEWILKDHSKFSFNLKKSLDEVFFDFCNQLVSPSKQTLKTLDEVVEYDKNVSAIIREIDRLNTAIKNCKQFNKKVELNMELKRAQEKLENYTIGLQKLKIPGIKILNEPIYFEKAKVIVAPTNSLSFKNPKLASEWHPTKNGNLTPSDVTLASPKKVWWKCSKGNDHEWQAKISNRSSLNQGCSVCSNRTVVLSNCLATTHPNLEKEWDYKKNSLTPFDVVSGNHNKFYWKCLNDKAHPSYLAAIEKRVANRNCPKCGELNRRKTKAKAKQGHSLGDLFPHLIPQWHFDLNGKTSPFDVNAKSHKKFWWKCEKGVDHIWDATLASRTRYINNNDKFNGCPVCKGFKIVPSNCLSTTHPHLNKEWHPTNNGNLTPELVFSGSHTKIWWQCIKNTKHPAWRVDIRNRAIKNSGCPECWPTPQSKEELTILFELKWIFDSIKPTGYNLKVNNKIWAVDIYIKELKLIIEYDGIYWHGKKENIDLKKTINITDGGYTVLRIRQQPLAKIQDHDISFGNKYDGKKITDNVLKYIIANYKLEKHFTDKIHIYLDSDELKNTKLFQIYIYEQLGFKVAKKR